MESFHARLDTAYKTIETIFNQFRANYGSEIPNPFSPVEVPENWLPAPADRNFSRVNPRATLKLGEGYVVKLRPQRGRGLDYIDLNPSMSRVQAIQEETNVRTLMNNGFTKENGFYVPYHKVIGINIVDGLIKVDESGFGLTISEDVSEDGKYLVTDINPLFFYNLDNRDEFLSDYRRHIDALLDLYHNPRINATINRHWKPSNPSEPISRMLLGKIQDKKGKIVIGDLDNILFEEI